MMIAELVNIPVPSPPPDVQLTMSVEEARLLERVTRYNVTVPRQVAGDGIKEQAIYDLLNDLRAVLLPLLREAKS